MTKTTSYTRRTVSKPRNFVDLALQKRTGSGSGAHEKSNKALRRQDHVRTKKEETFEEMRSRMGEDFKPCYHPDSDELIII